MKVTHKSETVTVSLEQEELDSWFFLLLKDSWTRGTRAGWHPARYIVDFVREIPSLLGSRLKRGQVGRSLRRVSSGARD